MDDFSEMQRVVLVSQRLVLLMLEESSPCLPLRRAEWGFLLNLSSPSRQTLSMKREYQCPVQKQRRHPADHFPSRIQHRPDQPTPDIRLCPSLLVHLHLKVLRSSFDVFLAGWGVTWTRARWLFNHCCLWDNYKLQAARGISWEPTVISWTRSFTVRVTESGPKTTQNHRWRLGKSLNFDVDWKCIKSECK